MQPQSDRSELYTAADGYVDVAKLIAAFSADEHAARANEYFKGIGDPWVHHLKKPFQSPEDARVTMAGLAAILSMGKIRPGDVVVDFGCGTGWLTAALALMRCRPIGLDVSAEALRIAAIYTDSLPSLRDLPIKYAVTGRTLPLPDASVDKVICFDAFHHVGDQDATISEFARVLRPGGSVLFHEPGPDHSRSEVAQMEMRKFAVIENDIVLDEMWETARGVGFTEMRMAIYTDRPLLVEATDFDGLVGGRGTPKRLAELGRDLLAHTSGNRVFSFKKAGLDGFGIETDSRSTTDLSGAISLMSVGRSTAPNSVLVRVRVKNTGRNWWRPSGEDDGSVNLAARLVRSSGEMIDLNRVFFSDAPVYPGDVEEVEFPIAIPDAHEQAARIDVDLVSEMVAWFPDIGHNGLSLPIEDLRRVCVDAVEEAASSSEAGAGRAEERG